ncbi:alpha-2-macroglobulin family protein [Marinicauda sp. Alg238-R41]|uniref:alpha-2-macroglobulin family protein n=1 Tax=Marinicauda sp. Alg238-R41 TaxID=2993447 RepID=UPI0022E1BDD4|nr:alpha-2-macroglobulin [Marinicauda sp. Alg238-R41]
MLRSIHLALWALAAGLVLASCGSGDDADTGNGNGSGRQANNGDLLQPRDEDAPRAGAEEATEFEYLRYSAELSGQQPRLCLAFSGALDPEVDYSAYVSVDEPVALNVEGSRLCIGGLSFGQTRTVTLREGLPSADGRELSAEVSETLSFASRPAFVGFSGDGVILPRIEADGLPIETVNVDEVRVRLTRVDDRALAFRSITSGYSASAGEWEWLPENEEPGEAGVTVWEGRMDTPGPANTAVVTVFPLAETIGTLEPGAYFVEVDDVAGLDDGSYNEPARARRWLIVTDLAFTAYRGDHGLEASVRSLQTAELQRGVEVQLVARSNEVLASETTGSDGHVSFSRALMNGEDGNAPRLLLAYGRSGDFALLDLTRAPVDLSDEPVSGRARPGIFDGYIYLDRGIYRPGESVHASALLRDGQGDALTGRAGTLTLYAPNGLEQARYRFDGAPNAGGLTHEFEIPEAAARGSWRLELSLDGSGTIATESFNVEDFVPQRVALELEADTETALEPGEARLIEADVRFLYGAPGAGLPIEGRARIQRDPSPFEAYGEYSFGLHDEQFAEELFELPASTADGSGQASIPLDPGTRGADSRFPLRVRAVISVQEPGGRAVSDDVILPYRPQDRYAGLRQQGEGRVERGEAARFDAIALDRQGDPVAADLSWRLVRVDWDYDWYRSEGSDWRWRRTRRVVPLETGQISLDGEAPASIVTRELDWGEHELILLDGETPVASTRFQAGWGGTGSEGVEAPDQVQVSGPATAPEIGDQVRIAINAPYAGLAEIAVATDSVIETRSIEVGEEGTQITLPVTEDWGAGAYVMVTVYTPRDPVSQPRPRRAVGVAYVPVNVEERRFDLEIETPDVAEPDQTLDVVIDATGGPVNEEAWVTLAAVDEGILLLTGFQSPEPADWFFGQTRLGVDLLDDYGRLLDPNQGAAAPVRSGGDQIGGAGLSVVPTQTVALFSGPVRLDRQGRATIALDLPDFNGELRLMAVAWSRTGLGSASEPLTVRDDVTAELILPRFLAPGDEALATATLDNVAGEPGDYAITVEATGPVRVEDASQSVSLDAGERSDSAVALNAAQEGIAEISLSVEGPDGFQASSAYPIQVRSPYLPASRIDTGVLQPGESYSPDPALLEGYVDGSGELQVSFSLTPINVSALFTSLSRYPYACSEQIVSRAFPLLYADQLAGLTGEESADDAVVDVQSTIQTLLARQSADGAFGLWRVGDQDANAWLGAYATDFLWRAEQAGYPVPDAALERALSALLPVMQGELWRASGYEYDYVNQPWSRDTSEHLTHRSSAYAAYVLARAGQADRSRLRYLHDELLSEIDSPLARAHIGAALAAIGDRARAASAFEAAIDRLGYVNEGDWYQTPRRDLAGVLALAGEAGLNDVVTQLADRVARDLPEPARLTTQEKAFLIMAARALAGDNETIPVAYSGEAQSPARVTFDQTGLEQAGRFTNTGNGPVWRTSLATGAPASAPAPAESGLTIAKRFAGQNGEGIDLARVSQGDRVVVVLTLQSKTSQSHPVVIADLLPAGFEIEAILNPSDAGETGAYGWIGNLSRTDVAEARDDRFVAALDVTDTDPRRLAYIVRAVTPGEFAYPGAVAEDMYDPAVFARSRAGRVTIQP